MYNFSDFIKNKMFFIFSFEVECGLILESDIVIDDIIFILCIYGKFNLLFFGNMKMYFESWGGLGVIIEIIELRLNERVI